MGKAEVLRSLDAAVAPVRGPWSEAVHSGPATVRHPISVAGTGTRLLLSLTASTRPARRGRTTHVRGQRAADPFHHERHFIGNKAHIAICRSENGQARTVADRHDDQQSALHLNDCL